MFFIIQDFGATSACPENRVCPEIFQTRGAAASTDPPPRLVRLWMRVPIVVYVDFESFTKPINSCQPDPDRSFTKAYQKHEPSGFCFYIFCDGKKSRPVLYTKQTEGENVADIFIGMLEKEIDRFWSSEVKEMILTEKDKTNFEKATECWICKKPFEDGEKKVRDHCHYTGKFRGATHNQCNLNFRKPEHIPVIFHNLAGYDSHLFIKSLGKTTWPDRLYSKQWGEIYVSRKEFTMKTRNSNTKLDLLIVSSSCQAVLINL